MADSQNLKFSSSHISKLKFKAILEAHINKMPPIPAQFIKEILQTIPPKRIKL